MHLDWLPNIHPPYICLYHPFPRKTAGFRNPRSFFEVDSQPPDPFCRHVGDSFVSLAWHIEAGGPPMLNEYAYRPPRGVSKGLARSSYAAPPPSPGKRTL